MGHHLGVGVCKRVFFSLDGSSTGVRWHWPIAVCAIPFVTGCLKRSYPARQQILSEIAVRPADAVRADADEPPADDVLEVIASKETSRFLGIWEGVVFNYRTLDENILARDLLRIERYYQARGYYDARVTATRIFREDEHHVRVEIRVRAGEPVRTRAIDVAGIASLPADVATELRATIPLALGRRLDERDIDATKTSISQYLRRRGFAFAKTTVEAHVDLARHAAFVIVSVDPGKSARYGPIRIVGLQTLPEDRVRSVLLFEQGDAYSSSDLGVAQEALLELGIFESVQITPDLSNPDSQAVPISVVVKEGSLRSVVLGIGARADTLRVSNHLQAGWSDRNFLGGLRQLSVEERPGVTYFPTRIGLSEAPTRALLENQLRIEFRQPTLVEGRTTSFIEGEYNIFPLLYPIPEGVDPRDERIIGYHQLQTKVGADRRFLGGNLKMTNSYNWQALMVDHCLAVIFQLAIQR